MKSPINNIMINCLLAALLCLAPAGCSGGEKDGGGGTGTKVTPSYNRSGMIRNPLSGWVMYVSGGANVSYLDTSYYVSDLAKTVKVADYVSACYIRTSWARLNPADGVYFWNGTDSASQQLNELVETAISRGLPVAFRIVVDGRDQGLNTPQFVFDAGAQYYLENASFPLRRTPYPQDPVFRQYYEKFIKAFAEKFNDPERCAFIDAYGLGKWGEAHNVVYESVGAAVTGNTETLKEQVFDWVTSLYANNFTRVPLVINYHRLVGHPSSWGSVNSNSEKLLTSAINKGYSLRHDAFGMNDYYQNWERGFASTWNYKRPIIMEGGWIADGHSYWNDPAGYRQGHPEDVRQGEFDASAAGHVNMMDFRVGNETKTWFEGSFSLVQRFISEGGYRLYPDQVYLPESVAAGADVMISHRWRNMGWGYFPNNIPQWNYRYKVAFALLDSSGDAKKIFIDTAAEPSEWLKDKPSSYEFKVKADVAAGSYTWAVAIVDTEKNNKPAINLATNNEKLGDGWVKLIDVTVK